MFTRLFGRWSRSKKLYKNELELLRIFLPSNNKNAESLIYQAINAPFIERKLVGANGYEAVIPYVLDDSMLIECDENLESPSIRVDATSGIALGFTTTILRGGFCGDSKVKPYRESLGKGNGLLILRMFRCKAILISGSHNRWRSPFRQASLAPYFNGLVCSDSPLKFGKF